MVDFMPDVELFQKIVNIRETAKEHIYHQVKEELI